MPRPQILILGLSIVIGLISLIYLLVIYSPIIAIETRYQSLSLIEEITGKRSFKSLFVPELDTTDPKLQQASIEIPSLYLHEPVIFNVNPADKAEYSVALQSGIAHALKTGLPGSGELGYYFAHSSNPEFREQYNAVFYLLNKLETGDVIYIWNEGEKHTYIVTKKEETSPNYVDFVTQTYNAETVVLQTCWPPGTTSRRLLVFAEKQL